MYIISRSSVRMKSYQQSAYKGQQEDQHRPVKDNTYSGKIHIALEDHMKPNNSGGKSGSEVSCKRVWAYASTVASDVIVVELQGED